MGSNPNWREETRTSSEFEKDMKDRTWIEKECVRIYIEEKRKQGEHIHAISTGADNSGSVIQGVVSGFPDYAFRGEDGIGFYEVKVSPVASKTTFKVLDLERYMTANYPHPMFLLVFIGTNMKKMGDKLDRRARCFIVSQDQIKLIIVNGEYVKENPTFGGKPTCKLSMAQVEKLFEVKPVFEEKPNRMTHTPEQFANVFNALEDVQNAGNDQWLARCPAHEDNKASLSVGLKGDKLLLNCHANCTKDEIIAASEFGLKDLFADTQSKPTPRQITSVFSYYDENGHELYQAIRYDPKGFSQRRSENGVWIWNMNGVRKVLYKLNEIKESYLQPVIIVEGEKDADRLHEIGFLGTCNIGGAGKWLGSYSDSLKGRTVAIIPDNDEAGMKHAEIVAGSLMLHGAGSIRIVSLPVKEKGDVSDWLNEGGDRAKLIEIIRHVPRWESIATNQKITEVE